MIVKLEIALTRVECQCPTRRFLGLAITDILAYPCGSDTYFTLRRMLKNNRENTDVVVERVSCLGAESK